MPQDLKFILLAIHNHLYCQLNLDSITIQQEHHLSITMAKGGTFSLQLLNNNINITAHHIGRVYIVNLSNPGYLQDIVAAMHDSNIVAIELDEKRRTYTTTRPGAISKQET